MNTLDIARTARDRIADPAVRYDFNDWAHCTCGNIWTAAVGEPAFHDDDVARPTDPRYAEAIMEIADVLGRQPLVGASTISARDAACFVSVATAKIANTNGIDKRAAAVALLDTAILALEILDRRAVVAEAEAITDAAAEQVPA